VVRVAYSIALGLTYRITLNQCAPRFIACVFRLRSTTAADGNAHGALPSRSTRRCLLSQYQRDWNCIDTRKKGAARAAAVLTIASRADPFERISAKFGSKYGKGR
jgi:hypothetical protein